MSECRDVLETSVSKRRPIVALGGRDPAENAAESMVVVVLNKASEGRLGIGKASEALPIEHFGLKDRPEGFDLCAWPCESTHWWPAKVPALDRLT